ncbi:MAG: SAM-dependent chlorinase/fluorinase, partial [Bacteroidota bacterium]
FMLRNVMGEFPAGTIHILGVIPDAGPDAPLVAVKHSDQYFLGADNGIFSLIFDQPPESIYELTLTQDTDLLTFPTKNVLVKAACHLSRGGTPEVIGRTRERLTERTIFRAVVDQHTIRGTVIYIDSYGNVITNITRQLWQEVGRGRDFTISFRVPGYDIHHLSRSYHDVVESERLALFGATGYLEIAINVGHASDLLGLKVNDIVRVEFQ